MSVEYYVDDFENYAEIFKEHALCVAELMKILDDEIISMGLPPVGHTTEARDKFKEMIAKKKEAAAKKK